MPNKEKTPKPPPTQGPPPDLIDNPKSVTYVLRVSANEQHHKVLWDGERAPMAVESRVNKVYRIVCAVYQTNRAAVSEWWVVLRGETPSSKSKVHVTQISAGVDVETGVPARTTPVIYASASGKAMLRLSEFDEALQEVQVTVTTYVNRTG